MSAVFPQEGQVASINRLLGVSGALSQTWSLRLYSNDRTPAKTDVYANYTQVTGGGYGAHDIVMADFTVTPGNPSQALYDDFVNFSFSGATDSPGTIYGYYIVDATNNILICAERFTVAPFTPSAGSLVRVRPIVKLGSINPV